MYRKRHKRGKRLASVFLTVAMITAAVPVQAAEFSTPDSFEQIFSSGEEDSYIADKGDILSAGSDPEETLTPCTRWYTNTISGAYRDTDPISHTRTISHADPVGDTGTIFDTDPVDHANTDN